MKIPAFLQQSWINFRQIPASVYVLGGTIALLLSLETAQTVKRASGFLPNAPVPIVATLHGLFLPSAPRDHNNINCKVDWYGLEEHLYFIEVSPEQSAKLKEEEKKAIALIDEALNVYASITACLDDDQIALLLKPQENVAAPYSLGLDCGSREHQLFSLYYLQQRAALLKKVKAGPPLIGSANREYQRQPREAQALAYMDPTRLLVSLHLLLDDKNHPITPQQASNLLQRYRDYCAKLSKLYRVHDDALHILTSEQLLADDGLAPRIWESSSSPVALRETKRIIQWRWQGEASHVDRG